jgi:hypothetical protein
LAGGGVFGAPESVLAASLDYQQIVLKTGFNGTTDFAPVCTPHLAACEVIYSEPGRGG